MMHRKRGWAVAAVLLVVLQLLLQTRAAHIVQQNPTVTVTLSSPLTAGQLAAAREWEKSNANTQAVTASFWSEKAAAVSADSDRTAEDVTCIGFDGTAQDCLPVEYLQGTAPGVVGQQCAISSTLAWTLFGSYDIMGLTVALDRTEYFISGVFKSKSKTLLYPAQSGFTHAGSFARHPQNGRRTVGRSNRCRKDHRHHLRPPKGMAGSSSVCPACPDCRTGFGRAVAALYLCPARCLARGSPVCFSTGICVGGTPFSANPARLAYPRPLE